MGRHRWWVEDSSPTWVPNMSCFRPGVASRESQPKIDEESNSTSPLNNENGFHQLGQNIGRKKWSHCRKMVWSLTLLLFSGSHPSSPDARTSPRLRVRTKKRTEGGDNRSWLLADSNIGEDRSDATTAVVDSQSRNSSFRFSFGSQVEAEVANSGDTPDCLSCSPVTTAAATVLILNLEEKEEEEDSTPCPSSDDNRKRHLLFLKCRRLQSLERSISPVIATELIRYSYHEISAAAGDFHEGRILGSGALSCVYKGRIGWGMPRRRRKAVAIKKMMGPEKECAKSFCRELLIAGSLRNPNVVPILGFCIDREGLFLVYKYVSGGSLDLHLHPENGDVSDKNGGLSWSVRFKIALRTAHAVEYLHYGTDKCIVHRDIKPSNILLSYKHNPKLCDFGLATWTHGPSLPFLCKNVRGTFGYLAPEYFQHGKLSEKTDVYAFGVVLLELITGRKPIDTTRPHGEENLVLWAKSLLLQAETFMKDLVDPRLRRTYTSNKNEIQRTVSAAAACLNNDESSRPRITEVISMLRGEVENCNGCSVAAGNGCFTGYEIQDIPPKLPDMRSHLALAMLGVSDEDNDC